MTSQSTRQFGQEQEQQACDYLTVRGLQLIKKNYQCKVGEIDLIMRDKETLVFVEVRYRKQNSYGGGLESVTRDKQRKIIRTAQYYLQTERCEEEPCRFDVVAITPNMAQEKIQWIKDAFWVQY